jgi:hypothetical protein
VEAEGGIKDKKRVGQMRGLKDKTKKKAMLSVKLWRKYFPNSERVRSDCRRATAAQSI